METIPSLKPLLAVLVSLAAAVLIGLSSRRPNLREFWTLAAAVAKFAVVASMLPIVLNGQNLGLILWSISPGITLELQVDPLGIFFGLVASGLWIFTSLYSIGYMRGLNEHHQTRYFVSFAVCLSATMGIAFSANLLTFLLFYEILTIATYPLVIHKETEEAITAGRKYLAYTLTAGVVLIAATAWAYQLSGTVSFRPGGFLSTQMGSPGQLMLLFALFIAGCGVKASLMPLHSWLPSAMVAPTPVSALLHAVAVVKAGVFGILRIVGYVFGPDLLRELGIWNALAAVAGFTLVTASLLALAQDNLKRRLAYSTVGHLSYIVLGGALLTSSSWTGGLLHLVNHATMKITLFFCAGAIYVKTHRENISELDGIGRQMPVTMAAFAVASMGLAGLPPINGFISKWYLSLGSLEADRAGFLALLVLSGLLNAGYFFPIVHRAFFRSSNLVRSRDEASPFMVVPLCLTALLSLALGLMPDSLLHFYRLATETTMSVLGRGGP